MEGRSQSGLTLIETMVTLAILGLLLVVVSSAGLIKTSEGVLRADALGLLGSLRAARSMATQSGTHHRVVLDLDQNTYRIELCEGPVKLRRADEETPPDQEAIAELVERRSSDPLEREMFAAESPEEAVAVAAALEGVRLDGARCTLATAFAGDIEGRPNQRQLRADRGVGFGKVWVQHLRDEVDEGIVSINFFPLGQSEKAVIVLESEDDHRFTLLVHGLTGKVEIRADEVDPDRHMRRDGAGDEVEDER